MTVAVGPEFLASFFTLAGDVHPFRPPAISPIPLRARIEAAGRAGFRGIGFGKDDLERSRATLSFADIGSIMRDNGIAFCELELLRNWFATGREAMASAADRFFLLQAAEQLQPLHIKIGSSGPDRPAVEIAAAFAMLCDQAAELGTAIVLEPSPIGRITTLEAAVTIVELAGRANGGLLLDLWHVTRSGQDLASIATLKPGIIRFAELCDGRRQIGDYIEDTVNHRLSCGTGSFAIAGFISAVRAAGYDGPFGIEILSETQRALAIDEAARTAFDGAAACFARMR